MSSASKPRPRVEVLHRTGPQVLHAVDPIASMVVVPTGGLVPHPGCDCGECMRAARYTVWTQGHPVDLADAGAAVLVYLARRGLLPAALTKFGEITGQEISVEEVDASGAALEATIHDVVDAIFPAAEAAPTPKPRFET